MIPLTRHGWREMLIGSLVLAAAAVGLAFIFKPLALIILPIWIWLFAFFRDPERPIPGKPGLMVSPADGKVSDIIEIDQDQLLGGPAVRVGIFLSVFNVHVNRAPCDGKVTAITYKRGKFISALRHNEASEGNESNTLVLAEADGQERPIAVVKQIVGLIARRIVCSTAVGERLTRGERFGMIKFGSRTELYIPKWLAPQVQVKVGDVVRGGMDVIATVNQAAAGAPVAAGSTAGTGAKP